MSGPDDLSLDELDDGPIMIRQNGYPLARQFASTICRPHPTWVEHCRAHPQPRLHYQSWVFDRHYLTGLQLGAVPEGVDLISSRVGRAFRTESRTENPFQPPVTRHIAMFPVDPTFPFVPPYPGAPPKDHDTPNRITSIFLDGTVGAWDARLYPQLFNCRRPWLPFMHYHHHRQWDSTRCESFSVNEYYSWNFPSDPTRGGRWLHGRLRRLLQERLSVEEQLQAVVARLRLAGKMTSFTTTSIRVQLYDTPYLDPFELDTSKAWTSYLDGLRPTSYTLQYVAEMKALLRWLTFNETVNCSSDPLPVDESLMGVWSPTISEPTIWRFLQNCGVPIFVVTRIPPTHSLYSVANATDGNFDADERYRFDSFQSEHRLDRCWHLPIEPEFGHIAIQDLHLESRVEYLPQSLSSPVRPTVDSNAKTDSPFLGWRSFIYMDPTMPRGKMFGHEHWPRLQEQLSLLESMSLDEPVHFKSLNPDTDRHPLLDVIKHPTGKKFDYYEEMYDDELECWYPLKLGHATRFSKDRLANAKYLWKYHDPAVIIVSEYPFPGRDREYGRQELWINDYLPRLGSTIDLDERPYWSALITPQGTRPLALRFTWRAFRDSQTFTAPRPTVNELRIMSPRAKSQLLDNAHKLLRSDKLLELPNQFSIFESPAAALALWKWWEDPLYAGQGSPALNGIAEDSEDLVEAIETDFFHDLSIDSPDVTHHVDDAAHPPLPTISVERAMTQRLFGLLAKWRNAIAHSLAPLTDEEVLETTQLRERVLDKLANARKDLNIQIERRIFFPVHGERVLSPVLYPVIIPNDEANNVCYPIRICSLEGGVPKEAIFALIWKLFDVSLSDVVVYGFRSELDMTETLDMGLRHAEDALLIQAGLHGVKIGKHLVEVAFLRGLVGRAWETADKDPQRPGSVERFRRALPLLSYPGVGDRFLAVANDLCAHLESMAISEGSATAEDLTSMRAQNFTMEHRVSVEWPSLLDPDALDSTKVKLPDRNTAKVASQTLPDDFETRRLYGFATYRMPKWRPSTPTGGRPARFRTSNAPRNNAKRSRLPSASSLSARRPPANQPPITQSPTDILLKGTTTTARRSLVRALNDWMSQRSAWRPEGLVLPPCPHLQLGAAAGGSKTSDEVIDSLVNAFEGLWRWQDESLAITREYQRAHPDAAYDYSVMEVTFSSRSRLDSVEGPYYSALAAALARRSKDPLE